MFNRSKEIEALKWKHQAQHSHEANKNRAYAAVWTIYMQVYPCSQLRILSPSSEPKVKPSILVLLPLLPFTPPPAGPTIPPSIFSSSLPTWDDEPSIKPHHASILLHYFINSFQCIQTSIINISTIQHATFPFSKKNSMTISPSFLYTFSLQTPEAYCLNIASKFFLSLTFPNWFLHSVKIRRCAQVDPSTCP